MTTQNQGQHYNPKYKKEYLHQTKSTKSDILLVILSPLQKLLRKMVRNLKYRFITSARKKCIGKVKLEKSCY